jgi:hypothetical protein
VPPARSTTLARSQTPAFFERRFLDSRYTDDSLLVVQGVVASPFSSSSQINTEMSLNGLPDELIIEIAERLTWTYSHGSLANFNQTSRLFRDVTAPMLYRSLILFQTDSQTMEEKDIEEPIAEGQPTPDSLKHTQ